MIINTPRRTDHANAIGTARPCPIGTGASEASSRSCSKEPGSHESRSQTLHPVEARTSRVSASRAAHVCAFPRCPTIVVGQTRCPEHTITRTQRQAKDPAQAKFYASSRWRAISLMVRREEPFCRLCKRARSRMTDHIDQDWRNCARENLRALCHECNASLTAKQHRAKVRK